MYLFFAVMGGMAAYEGLKMVAIPHVTMWVSHLMTIGVSSVAAVAAGYLVLQRQSRMQSGRPWSCANVSGQKWR